MTDHKPIKTVSIIGLGAIGSFFAFQLQKVLGDRLRIIAGGERKERLKRDGVTVNGVNYHFHIVSPDQDCGGDYPDLAIIITKFPVLSQAIQDIKNQIGPDTLIMAPLNGVEAEDMVASHYGWDNILYSLAKVSVVMKDGQASFKPDAARIEFGEKRNTVITPRVRAVRELFESAGIRCVIPEDMERAIWFKYMCNVSENQSAAVLGISYGAWCVSEHANFIREALMREVIAVAGKKGISLTEEDMAKQVRVLEAVPPGNKPSTFRISRPDAGRKWRCLGGQWSVWAGSWEWLPRIMRCSIMQSRCWNRRMKGFSEKRRDGEFGKYVRCPLLWRGKGYAVSTEVVI